MSIVVDNYWSIVGREEYPYDYPYDLYINMSEFGIRKSITRRMKKYIKTTFKEPMIVEDVPIATQNLRDILRIINHHYRAGLNICVFCYHGINRSAACKYAYDKYYLCEDEPRALWGSYAPCNELMFDVIKRYEEKYYK